MICGSCVISAMDDGKCPSVMCGVRVNMMERRPLVAVGRKATNQIRDIDHFKAIVDLVTYI